MISKSFRLLALPLLKRANISKASQQSRNFKLSSTARSEWVYRGPAPDSAKWTYYAADAFSAFTWWWIFIHCYYQFGHLVGEYDYPEPEKWSDAELGVVDE